MESNNSPPEKIQTLFESFGPNAGLVEELLEEYLSNPASVSPSWQSYFQGFFNGGLQGGKGEQGIAAERPSRPITEQKPSSSPGDSTDLYQRFPVTELRGVAARIVENMEASLSLPTATSIRTMPVKVLEENRRLLNHHLAPRNGARISYTHIIA